MNSRAIYVSGDEDECATCSARGASHLALDILVERQHEDGEAVLARGRLLTANHDGHHLVSQLTGDPLQRGILLSVVLRRPAVRVIVRVPFGCLLLNMLSFIF